MRALQPTVAPTRLIDVCGECEEVVCEMNTMKMISMNVCGVLKTKKKKKNVNLKCLLVEEQRQQPNDECGPVAQPLAQQYQAGSLEPQYSH